MLKLTAVLKQLAKHPSVFHDYRRRGHKGQLHRRTLLSPSAGDQSEATIPRGWSPYSLQIRAPGQHLPQNTTVELYFYYGFTRGPLPCCLRYVRVARRSAP